VKGRIPLASLAFVVWGCMSQSEAPRERSEPVILLSHSVGDLDERPATQLTTWDVTGPNLDRGRLACFKDLPEGGFVLGIGESTCRAGNQESRARARLVPSGDRRIAALHIRCMGACADAVVGPMRPDAAGAGRDDAVSVELNGRTLWSARCKAGGACDRLALGEMPVVTVRVDEPEGTDIELRAAPGVRWPIAGVEVEWLAPTTEIQGIAYSPFRDCQNPNRMKFPSREQIAEDLDQLRHSTNAIRTYSSVGIQGEIPKLAHERGLRVSAGAWLGKDEAANEREIEGVVDIAKRVPLESVIVGNEVLMTDRMCEDRLIDYIKRVKAAVTVPVTTAEVGSVLLQHPKLMAVLDYYLVHYYAFWEGHSIDGGAQQVLDELNAFRAHAGGKRVVIGETGWPSDGATKNFAAPTAWNQRRFFREFLSLAHSEHVEFFYFGAFDELWKTDEGSVGQFWGVWDAERRNKYDCTSMMRVAGEVQNDHLSSNANDSPSVPFEKFQLAVYTNYGSLANRFIPKWLTDPNEPGEVGKIQYDDCAEPYRDLPRDERPHPYDRWNERAMRIEYNPASDDRRGWGGIRWLDLPPEPADTSCKGPRPGTLVAAAPSPTLPISPPPQQLRFKAWAEPEGAEVKFFVGGGCEGQPLSWIGPSRPVQDADATGFARLTREPREYFIDLRGVDLSRLTNKFGVVMARSRTPNGVRLFLDDVVYDGAAPPQPRQAPSDMETAPMGERLVYGRGTFGDGFGMGVESSTHNRNWVSNTTREGGYMELRYPSGERWGAVFVTVGGDPSPRGKRCGMDLSMYRSIAVELKGEHGGEVLSIGLKDVDDPDDGSEIKKSVTLEAGWQVCRFPLSLFASADLKHLYVPIEFVFESGIGSETIGFRDVRYTSEVVAVVTCQ
jgi:exo-beta-1,3-glucanase (GH17 family)